MFSVEQLLILLKDRRIDVVARGAGLSESAVSHTKNGYSNPSPETRQKLTDYFLKQWKQANQL